MANSGNSHFEQLHDVDCWEVPALDGFETYPAEALCRSVTATSEKASHLLACDGFVKRPHAAFETEKWHDVALPVDPAFRLESSSIYFGEALTLEQLADATLEFLRTQPVEVMKLKPSKASIKAQVFAEGLSCIFKVRIYSARGLVMEFQHRRGNTCAFASVFEAAVAFFAERCGACAAADWARRSAPPSAPALSEECDEVDLGPLLVLAEAEHGDVAAEAAAGLSMAPLPALREVLGDPRTEVLLSLLEAQRLDVAYPSAQLFRRLVQADCGPGEQLLTAARCRASAWETPELLRHELTEALSLVPAC